MQALLCIADSLKNLTTNGENLLPGHFLHRLVHRLEEQFERVLGQVHRHLLDLLKGGCAVYFVHAEELGISFVLFFDGPAEVIVIGILAFAPLRGSRVLDLQEGWLDREGGVLWNGDWRLTLVFLFCGGFASGLMERRLSRYCM